MAKDGQTWYHGRLSADEATKVLTKFRQPGAFLLRDSQNAEGAFTLTVSCLEDGNHVDVQHYRIVKSQLNSKQLFKIGKKKLPSLRDLEKCLYRQSSTQGEIPPALVTPITKSMIKEWDRREPNWREQIKVHDLDAKIPPEKQGVLLSPEDPNKHSSKIPAVASSEGKKESRKITEDHQYVYLDDCNSSSCAASNSCTVGSDNFDDNTTAQDFQTDHKMHNSIEDSSEALDQNNDVNKKEGEDHDLQRNDENSSKSTEQVITNMETKTDKECRDVNNDNHPSEQGIYMSSAGIITSRNKMSESSPNSGIYIAPNQITTSNSNNSSPSVNEQELKSGIYM